MEANSKWSARKKKRKLLSLKANKNSWLKGTVCPIKNDTLFIKPLEKLPKGYDDTDVYVKSDDISKYILPLKGGDFVEFILGENNSKPVAQKVRVSCYPQRTCNELVNYINNLREELISVYYKTVLVEILPNIVMWNFLGSPIFSQPGSQVSTEESISMVYYIERLLLLLLQTSNIGKAHKSLMKESLKAVLQGKIFQSKGEKSLALFIKSSQYYVDEDKFFSADGEEILSAELVRNLCKSIIRNTPSIARCLLPTVLAITEKTSAVASTQFLYKLLQLSLSGENTEITNLDIWQELPLILTHDELTGRKLLTKDKHLAPVKTRSPYLNPEEYMDIYFRLLRAEAFASIQEGIQQLKCNQLDTRDMNVYYDIHLAGFDLQHGRFSLAIYFRPATKVTKWENSTKLMFGNLMCISLNRKFDDVIWATVSNRDTEMLNKYSVIMLELIKENTKSMSEIINLLQSNTGSGVMAESPTYYHSVSPVLRSLKGFDMDNFPLQQEVIFAKSASKSPRYLEEAETLDPKSVIQSAKNEVSDERMKVRKFLEVFKDCQTSLEESQSDALVHVLQRRLAIIQGPPGCGKTFIGVKIVQLLLSLSPKLEKPILLLTYKNHALDEFLKQMLEFCGKNDLVRIGGRSKEPALEPCNLQAVMKSLKNNKVYSKAVFTKIQETKKKIQDVETQIKELTFEVEASSRLTKKSFVDELSEDQLRFLLIEAKPAMYNRKNNAWIKELVSNITQKHCTLKEFLMKCIESGVLKKNSNDDYCFNVFNKVFQEWFPDRQELLQLKAIQTEFTLQLKRTTLHDEEPMPNSDDECPDDSGDEDYVRELAEARIISGIKQEKNSKNSLVIFNSIKSKEKDVLIDISDYPNDMTVNSQIRNVKSLWDLTKPQRLQFLYSILSERTTSISQELNDLLEQLQQLRNCKEELEINEKVQLLSRKKIIGVTITGASIHHDLLHHIGPSVVIVEEAAEILEPSLLAALTPSIEHLILIGDHKQLRPQVNAYELRKNFHFDVSMMERLIECAFEYKTLVKQNRMRPEFSALLHDIYPNLEDNLAVVSKNEPLKCIEKSMFFWSHNYPEQHDRSYTNLKEAERIRALVIYLLCNGVRPCEITVLAAYLGQTKILRSMLKELKTKMSSLFKETDAEGFIQVQTIDMYQGDENKYVLISLVRSNKEGKIGFLKERNRRCVTQSRAKCGMYFVGNVDTFYPTECWTKLIGSMKQQHCLGQAIPLQCTKHKGSKYPAVEAENIDKVISNPKLLCKLTCRDLYACGKHHCKKSCFPRHVHTTCPELVWDKFQSCSHPVHRKCTQSISELRCDELVMATFPRCGHETEKKCHEETELLVCQHPCKKINSCGKHRCKKHCGESHGHDSCPIMVEYTFPDCNHPSTDKKKCTEAITWKCNKTMYFVGSCGHLIQKKCHQKDGSVKCPVKPCVKLRKCGHPCPNTCGEHCEKGDCKKCLYIYQQKMKRAQYLADEIRIDQILFIDEVSDQAEYQTVEDQVLKFIQPMHHWFPEVTKIEKVTNIELETKFEEAKSKAFGEFTAWKFHGTSDEGVKGITENGFKMPNPNPSPCKRSMYGQGIYFATDSSKSAQEIYTKGSKKLLLCNVLLGKSKEVSKADNSWTKEKLIAEECDSLHAPRGTDVKNDEFVIFDPDQALPEYIIHYTFQELKPAKKKPFLNVNMKPARTVDLKNPREMFYRTAEAHFRRMANESKPPLSREEATIESIDIVMDRVLHNKFEATKQEFGRLGIPNEEILAYHGTDKRNIGSILRNNLQVKYARRQLYGKGNYFSEFPAISLKYGDGLLLCRILPGKEYIDNSNCDIPQGYNSKKVLLRQPSETEAVDASGEMIIIENSDQILPFFVIHRRNRELDK